MAEPIYNFDPERTTNAQAIAAAAALDFLDGIVLDLTVGPEAGFWRRWRPARLVTNDIDPEVPADHHFDARAFPWPDASFDTVVVDPQYGYRGTSRLASDVRYGLARPYVPAADIDANLFAITTEALRLARCCVLVKCEDQNVSGRYRPQRHRLLDHAEALGATVVGELYVYSPRAQPSGKRQLNIWTSCSTLVILQPGSERRHPERDTNAARILAMDVDFDRSRRRRTVDAEERGGGSSPGRARLPGPAGGSRQTGTAQATGPLGAGVMSGATAAPPAKRIIRRPPQ
jgi:hypothetical protein